MKRLRGCVERLSKRGGELVTVRHRLKLPAKGWALTTIDAITADSLLRLKDK